MQSSFQISDTFLFQTCVVNVQLIRQQFLILKALTYFNRFNLYRKDKGNKQIRIEERDGKFGFAAPCEFVSVPELIDFYRTRSLKEYSASLDIMLLYPVCREVSCFR